MFQHLLVLLLVSIVAMEVFYSIMSMKHEVDFKQKMLKLEIESLVIIASVFCYIGYALWGL